MSRSIDGQQANSPPRWPKTDAFICSHGIVLFCKFRSARVSRNNASTGGETAYMPDELKALRLKVYAQTNSLNSEQK